MRNMGKIGAFIISVLLLMLFIDCSIADKIDCKFTTFCEVAEIGKPYTIHYELSGGSGDYTDVTFQALFPLRNGLCIGGKTQPMSGNTGSWTLIPEEGKAISFQIYGRDSNNMSFYIDGPQIPTVPNQDFDVKVNFNENSVKCGDTVEAAISVCGDFDIFSTLELYWVVIDKGEYTYDVNKFVFGSYDLPSDDTISLSDYIHTLTTSFGDSAYLVIKGRTPENAFLYYESDLILISGSPARQPITVSFDAQTKEAYIGQPFLLHYELSGGSGIFPDVTVQVLFPYRGGMSVGGESYHFTSNTDECTIIPREGMSMSIQIHGHDSFGQYFYIHGPEYELNENPDYPVNVSFSKDTISINKPLTVNFDLGNIDLHKKSQYNCERNCELSWIIRDDNTGYTYFVDPTEIVSPQGSATIIPAYGEELFVMLKAQTEDGHYIFVDRGPIKIMNDLSDEYSVILPDSLQMVESQSFYSTSVYRVKCPEALQSIGSLAFGECAYLAEIYIPKSVTYIAPDAFVNSPNVTVVCYPESYAESYAIEHALRYEYCY